MTPVYLFTGFLDSGKSTLIKATLEDPGFMENAGRTLIMRFEEGETDFDEAFLKEHNACMETYDDVHVLTPEKCRELDTVYHPFQVFIEWNGTTPVTEAVLKNMPDFWPLVEVLTTVDGSAAISNPSIGARRCSLRKSSASRVNLKKAVCRLTSQKNRWISPMTTTAYGIWT